MIYEEAVEDIEDGLRYGQQLLVYCIDHSQEFTIPSVYDRDDPYLTLYLQVKSGRDDDFFVMLTKIQTLSWELLYEDVKYQSQHYGSETFIRKEVGITMDRLHVNEEKRTNQTVEAGQHILSQFELQKHFIAVKQVHVDSNERIVDVGIMQQSNTFYEFEFKTLNSFSPSFGKFLAVHFKVSDQVETHQRTVYNILDFIGDIGGLFDGL